MRHSRFVTEVPTSGVRPEGIYPTGLRGPELTSLAAMCDITSDMSQFESLSSVEIRRHRLDEPWTYALLDRRQREVAARVRAGGAGAILLSEVAPVITLGRRTQPRDLLISEAELRARGIEVQPTDRGGLATYHGPGQWVLFIVESLERLTGDRRGVRRAVNGLLSIGREVGLAYHSDTEIRDGCEAGVWTREGKFAAVGIHVEEGVLLHGLAINGYRTSTSFQGLRPCGLDAPVGFLLSRPDESAFQALGERIAEVARKLGFADFAVAERQVLN